MAQNIVSYFKLLVEHIIIWDPKSTKPTNGMEFF